MDIADAKWRKNLHPVWETELRERYVETQIFLRWKMYIFSGFVSRYLLIMLSVPTLSEMPWEIFP